MAVISKPLTECFTTHKGKIARFLMARIVKSKQKRIFQNKRY